MLAHMIIPSRFGTSDSCQVTFIVILRILVGRRYPDSIGASIDTRTEGQTVGEAGDVGLDTESDVMIIYVVAVHCVALTTSCIWVGQLATGGLSGLSCKCR